MTKQQYAKLAVKAARLADSKKAGEIIIYDISRNSSLFYYAVLATVEALPQLRAVEEEIVTELKKDGAYSQHRDGSSCAKWRALDYGGFIVHIFDSQTRRLYALDKLYASCRQIPWEEIKEKPVERKPKKKALKSSKKKAAAAPKKKPVKKTARKNATRKA